MKLNVTVTQVCEFQIEVPDDTFHREEQETADLINRAIDAEGPLTDWEWSDTTITDGSPENIEVWSIS